MKKILLTIAIGVAAFLMLSSCNNLNSTFAVPGTHWVYSLGESTNFNNNDTLPSQVYTYFNNLNYGYFGYETDRSTATKSFEDACKSTVEALADERLESDTYVVLGLYMITEDSSKPQEIIRETLDFHKDTE